MYKIKTFKPSQFLEEIKNIENFGYLFSLTEHYVNYDELYLDDNSIHWDIVYEDDSPEPLGIVAWFENARTYHTQNHIYVFEINRHFRGKGKGSKLLHHYCNKLLKGGVSVTAGLSGSKVEYFYFKNGFNKSNQLSSINLMTYEYDYTDTDDED